MGLNKKEMW